METNLPPMLVFSPTKFLALSLSKEMIYVGKNSNIGAIELLHIWLCRRTTRCCWR